MSNNQRFLEGFVSLEAFADECDVTLRTADRWTKDSGPHSEPLPSLKIGRRRYVDIEAARQWLRRRAAKTTVRPTIRTPAQQQAILKAAAVHKEAAARRRRGRPRKDEKQQAAE